MALQEQGVGYLRQCSAAQCIISRSASRFAVNTVIIMSKVKSSDKTSAMGGWVADCHSCGKVGRFRNPSTGRPTQHSTSKRAYCGYFTRNPRYIDSACKKTRDCHVDNGRFSLSSLPLPLCAIEFSLDEIMNPNLLSSDSWTAECNGCGRVGPYKRTSQGRLLQHTAAGRKYCGYYKLHPRPVIEKERPNSVDSVGETCGDFAGSWIAECHTCGEIGPYCPPSQGRFLQHNLPGRKYCGYYKMNPRCFQPPNDVIDEVTASAITAIAPVCTSPSIPASATTETQPDVSCATTAISPIRYATRSRKLLSVDVTIAHAPPITAALTPESALVDRRKGRALDSSSPSAHDDYMKCQDDRRSACEKCKKGALPKSCQMIIKQRDKSVSPGDRVVGESNGVVSNVDDSDNGPTPQQKPPSIWSIFLDRVSPMGSVIGAKRGIGEGGGDGVHGVRDSDCSSWESVCEPGANDPSTKGPVRKRLRRKFGKYTADPIKVRQLCSI